MRLPIRSAAALLLAVGVATCSDTPLAAVKSGATPAVRSGIGGLALAPVFSRSAAYAAQHLADFGISFDSVRVLVRGFPDTTIIVKDTTVFFDRNSNEITLELTVPVQGEGQRFDAGIDYTNAGGVVFHGHAVVQSHAPDQPAPPQQSITINYVGPGARVARIAISPRTVTLSGTQTQTLSVSAVDSVGGTIAVPPISWASSNTTVAAVSGAGVVSGLGRRGTATITAATPTGVTDNVGATVVLPAAAISVVSGAGQTGKAGASLASPAVVQVSASDGVGVGGVNVVFSSPAGGAVGTSSATTDATGRASTTLRLGSTAGPQSFAATAAGFSAAIPATATPADPATIVVVSGSGQSDTVRKSLAPLVVRVADAFNNAVPGVSVAWSRSAGTGTLGAATSTTNADGQASNTYTLGSTPGAESVSASTAGVTAPAAFAFTTLPAAPAAIIVVSGSGQSAQVGAVLESPMVVRVTDVAGNPVPGATVTWSTSAGTIAASSISSATGETSNSLTMPTVPGPVTVTASIANGQRASFLATALPGRATALSFLAQPLNGVSGIALPSITVRVLDSFGNLTAATVPVTLGFGTNTAGATLGGTLTRNAVAGVATFNDITVDRNGSGYTLAATSPLLTAATSSAFSISAGAASGMTIFAGNGQTAVVNSALSIAPAVRIVDASNNPIAGVAVTFTPAQGSGVVAPAGGVVTTNAQGVAALTSWTLGTAAGAQSLTGSAPGLSNVSFGATAVAGSAFKLALKNKAQLQASAVSGIALSPQPFLQVVDQFGNPVAGSFGQVTASVTGTGLSTGGATPAVVTSTGSAVFSGLQLVGTGATRIVLSLGTGPIAPDTSGVIAVTTAGPTQLVLVPSSPTSLSFVAGAIPTNAPVLKTLDASGVRVPFVLVHLSITSQTLQVPVAVDIPSDTSGSVAFASALPTTAGVYTITATSTQIPGATVTATVTITPAVAAKLDLGGVPGTVQAAATFSPVVVRVLDAYGNVVTNATNQVSIGIATGPTGAVILGGGAATPVNGVATFNALSLAAVGNYTLSATATGGLTSVNNPTVAVIASAPAAMTVSAGDNQTAAVNTAVAVPPAVRLTDGSGNPLIGVPVTFVASTGGVLAPSDGLIATNAQGVAQLGGWTLGTAAGAYTVVASSPGLQNVTVHATALAGSAFKLTLTNKAQIQTSAVSGTALSPQPSLQVVDQFGNPVAGSFGQVTASVTGTNFSLGGAASAAVATTGSATFTGLQLIGAGATRIAFSLGTGPIAPDTSAAVSVTPGGPTQLAISPSMPTPYIFSYVAGSTPTNRPVLRTLDARNVRVQAVPVRVVVTPVNLPQTVADVTIPSDTAGTVAFLTSLPTAAGSYTVTATSTSIPNVTVTATVTILPDAPAGFLVTAPTTTPAGSSQTAVTATLEDQYHNRISTATPRTVNWSVAGSGTVANATSQTDTAGRALNIYNAPSSSSGSDVITVTDAALTAVTGTLSVTPQIAAPVFVFRRSWSTPSALPGTVLPSAPSVLVTLGNETPVAGASVTFSVTQGGGTIRSNGSVQEVTTSQPVLTDANGVASIERWTLGSAVGTNALTATVGTASTTFNATAADVQGMTLVTPLQTSIVTGALYSPQPQIQLVDGAGAPVRVSGIVVTASVAASFNLDVSSPRLTGTLQATTDAFGVATFTNLRDNNSGLQPVHLNFDATAGITALPRLTSPNLSIVAPTASAMVANSALVLSTPVNTLFTSYPSVLLTDAQGAPIGGVAVTFATSAPCSSPNIGFSGGPDGIVALTASFLSVPYTAPTTCTVTATTSGVAPITFTIVVVPASGQIWTGAASSAWSTGANWFSGTAPNVSDPVFIPAHAIHAPQLSSASTIGSVVVENGAVLNLGGNTLTVGGNVDANTGGIIIGGTVLATGCGSNIRGALPTLILGPASGGSGTFDMIDPTVASGSVTLNCGLNLNGNVLAVTGDFATQTNGFVLMDQSSAALSVQGNVTFAGNVPSSLTAGSIGVGKDFVQGGAANSFAPPSNTVNFNVYFQGTGPDQTVVLQDPAQSGFANVLVAHPTTFLTPVRITSAFTAGTDMTTFNAAPTIKNMVIDPGAIVRLATDMSLSGSLDVLSSGILTNISAPVAVTVAGPTVTQSLSDLSGIAHFTSTSTTFPTFGGTTPALVTLAAATTMQHSQTFNGALEVQQPLTIAGYVLTTNGNLTVNGANGALVMQNVVDHVVVNGNAAFAGASASTLTAGNLDVAGNFTQSNGSNSFAPTAAHTTKLNGTGAQDVTFASPTGSNFYNLNITNPSSSGVTLRSIVNVANNLTVGASAKVSGTFSSGGTRLIVGGAVSAASTADLGGLDSLRVTGTSFPVYSNTTAGKAPHITEIASAAALTANATVAGGLSIGGSGSLDVGTRTLTVKDSLIVNGRLDMLVSNSTVIVTGLTRFQGPSTIPRLQAGLLRVGGNFYQSGAPTSFAPSGGFLVQFNGASGTQDVMFDSPNNSKFADIEINGAAGVNFNSNVTITGNLEQKSSLTIPSSRTATVAGTANFRSGATTSITGTLGLAIANFYSGSKTTGNGTLTVASCSYSVSLAGTDLFVGGGAFSLTSCSNPGRVLP